MSSKTLCGEPIEISGVTIEPMTESQFLKPLRMKFTQNKRKRCWDFLKIHESVSIIIFNVSRNVLVLVRQFRPPLFFNSVFDDPKTAPVDINTVDWTKVNPATGVSLEVCAGIMDKKDLTPAETAKEEVLEECGYDVPLQKFELVTKLRSGVGYTGGIMYMFYVEVDDGMKVNKGGGNPDEGEFIDVVEMSIPEIEAYMNQPYIQSPGDFGFAMNWFLLHKAKKIQ